MADYDLEEAFEAIENELINSMIRNMEHHRVEEITEGFEWTQWQAEELSSLEAYRKSNRKKYNKKFKEINEKIEYGIRKAHRQGRMDEEIRILEAIKKGFVTAREPSAELQGSFFGVNDRKLDALVEATMHDMKKAETAMLRMADDQYRKTIFNAQVYANTGAGTYEQAIDMATKDFRARGINCIEYKNGARVNIASYAAMAIRTANTRAYLQGEGTKRQEWGISTVIVGRRGHACLKCLKWVGKVLIDDVWSGGKKDDGPYPLMSTAMSAGLYHPNCKDTHTTYFPGISEEPKPLTRQEVEDSKAAYMREQEINYANRQKDKFKRLADGALDPTDKERYKAKAKEWRVRAKNLKMSAVSRVQVDFSKHLVKEDAEGVIRATKLAQDIGVKLIGFGELKNGDIMIPFLEKLQSIKEEYGVMFTNISCSALDSSDMAMVTPSKALIVNSNYFNSPEAFKEGMRLFKKLKVLPKDADIGYIASHEWGHFISVDEIKSDKSKIVTLYKRFLKKGKAISYNQLKDPYEFAADCIAAELCDIDCKYSQDVIKYCIGGDDYVK
ncbi:MAG: phage minor capsid protein [Eubacterium sp.]|nr:phage minor capsid protein [Eubacterium sp.]